MSIQTDLASIEILANVYQNQSMNQTLQEMVHTFSDQVPYVDWAGIYLYKNGESTLEAATDTENALNWEANSELKIPLETDHYELGKIVLKSRQPICFDVTDVSTLQKVAQEISDRLYVN